MGSLDDWTFINTMLLAGERECAAEQIEGVSTNMGLHIDTIESQGAFGKFVPRC